MDVLKYKTVTGTDGNTTVAIGINLAQVLKISRKGEQKDYAGLVALSTLDGSDWTFLSVGRRISFGTSFPFIGSEEIHILYKVTL